MNLDIETLLTNTILSDKNANVWKGDYVIDKMDKLVSKLSRDTSSSAVFSVFDVESCFQGKNIDVVKTTCWMPSGYDGVRLNVVLNNIRCSLFFEEKMVRLQVELNAFMLDKKVYDVTSVDSKILVDGMLAVDEEIGQVCNNWADLVGQCTKKVKMIKMQYIAAEGYLRQQLKGSNLKFELNMTSECIVVFLIADGEKELTTSLTLSDDFRFKIDSLINEMNKWLECSKR